MQTPMQRIIARKALIIGIIIVLAGGGYYSYKKWYGSAAATNYVTAAAEKGTLIVSVSGTGQVSAQNQIDIKAKASGDIASINMKEGQHVAEGAVLVRLDTRDAEKAVRDAQANLDSAELTLAKLRQPPDVLSILQAENALDQANESKLQTATAITKGYADGFNAAANAFLDLPTAMAGLQDIIYSTSFGGGQWNIDYYVNSIQGHDEEVAKYRADVVAKYQDARKRYDKNFIDYKATGRFSDTAAIDALINETYDTTKSIAESVKSTSNLIQFYEDKLTERNQKPNVLADTHLALLSTYTSKTNTHLVNLYQAQQTIRDNQSALVGADRTIAERTESLAKLKIGTDPLDIRSQELSVTQRRNALSDAQEKLSDYSIRAPFAGIITKSTLENTTTVSSGTTVATLITQKKIAEISLNEVDVAKIKVRQKATLTFDAIPELTISGEVAEIDVTGTIAQGVVSYTVKIGFDTQDERVKPSMSVSAAIITDVKQDVILVPNAAVKTSGNTHTIEVLVNGASQSKTISLGLSNDTMTEITSGIREGDVVVTQTISASTAQTAVPAPGGGGFRIPGITGGR